MGPIGDAAGAEADDEVAGRGHFGHHAGELRRIRQGHRMPMAAGAQTLHKGVAVDAFDRRFSRAIDFGDDYMIGVVEAAAEFLEQVARRV